MQLPSLKKIVEANELMASFAGGGKVIGVAMNSRLLKADEAEAERERVRSELGVPVCDVIRHGPDDLVGCDFEVAAEVVSTFKSKAG